MSSSSFVVAVCAVMHADPPGLRVGYVPRYHNALSPALPFVRPVRPIRLLVYLSVPPSVSLSIRHIRHIAPHATPSDPFDSYYYSVRSVRSICPSVYFSLIRAHTYKHALAHKHAYTHQHTTCMGTGWIQWHNHAERSTDMGVDDLHRLHCLPSLPRATRALPRRLAYDCAFHIFITML